MREVDLFKTDMRDASYEIPKYYECLEFSTCGCVAAGYSDTEKKIIVINNESGRQREIDVRENLYPNKKYQNVLRIEKTLVYACLFICPDFEFHVEVDMRSKKWKIHKQFTDQFTDKTISDNGKVIVEQWDNSDGGLDYSFERDKSLVTILTAPHLRTVSNEPMMMLSHPAGKYCYIKSLGTLFEIEPQKQLKMPFKKPYMQIEWIDDAHNVCPLVCTGGGFDKVFTGGVC